MWRPRTFSSYVRVPDSTTAYAACVSASFGASDDEALDVLLRPETIDAMAANSDLLFRPYFAGVRADPRFMVLSNRLDLLAYWRKANAWPDFCSDPQPPYDCRKEAEKYRA